ncbi:hypothetical protein ACFS7Z_08660 [Pontibacter toksunensis]|uniref:DNA-directed RNA polymerase n=1 Tax=Pontibacter toksunensis TaxID=1332631 RepID=A0ABW6BU00_9BACT
MGDIKQSLFPDYNTKIIIEMEHGQKDPATGKYWNGLTKKWLKKPVRDSTKGQHIGKAKGKAKGLAVGKAVGKAKWLVYNKKLEKIKASHPGSWKSHGWLPINLSIEVIKADAVIHWKDKKTKFEIDRALALSSLLIIMRCKMDDIQKRKSVYSEGYVNLHNKDLKYYVGRNYKKYITFFKDAEYIRGFYTGFEKKEESYCPNAFAKMYKWHQRHLNKPGDLRMYQRVEYSSQRLLLRLFEIKEEKRQQILKQTLRHHLIANVFKMAPNIDVDGFTSWALANPGEFNDKEALNNVIVNVNSIKNGDIYITASDLYGERFHSVFTNTSRHLRKYININGTTAKEIDLKASQFFFFACMVLHPDQCLEVLKKEMKQVRLNEIMHTMKHYYDSYEDVKEFVDVSLTNSIYQTIMSKFNGQYGKTYVKDLCFRAFFSRSGQSKEEKDLLKAHYPNVIRLCEIINNRARKEEKQNVLNGKADAPIYSVPQLLQRLESRIMIDIIALKASGLANRNASLQACHEFTSVHDSFIIAAADEQIFRSLIATTFADLGLPAPVVECK